ncbi:MAG: hypothetical protein ACKO96_04835 [Flammeovirgaceae bacterium]
MTIVDNVINSIFGSNGGAQFMPSFRPSIEVSSADYTITSSDRNALINVTSNRVQTVTIPFGLSFMSGVTIGVAYSNRLCEIVAGDGVTINTVIDGVAISQVGGRRFYPVDGSIALIIAKGNNVYQLEQVRRRPSSAREAADFALVIDPLVAANITETVAGNGIVASYRDREANDNANLQPVLSRSSSGTDILWNRTNGTFQFQAGRTLVASGATLAMLQKAVAVGQDYTVIVMSEYNWEADQTNGAAICHSHLATDNRFIMRQQSQQIRVGNFNGTVYANLAVFNLPSYNATHHVRRCLISYTNLAPNSSSRELRFNNGVVTATGTNPAAPSTTVGFAIGGETNGTRLFTGTMSFFGISKYALNEAEIIAVNAVIADIEYVFGVGQSNEANKHSTTSPYFRDGARGLMDYRNAQNRRNVTHYVNAAISGSSLSRQANDYLGYVANNSWVDDRTATLVDDVLLTGAISIIKITWGLSKNEKFSVSIGNLESELFWYTALLDAGLRAKIKAAYNYLLDRLKAEFPNAIFYTSEITRRNNNTGLSFQFIRETLYEIRADNASRLNYGADFFLDRLLTKDPTHYDPDAYFNQCQRMAARMFNGILAPIITGATLSGNSLTVNISDPQGIGFTATAANMRIATNVLANAREYELWTQGTSSSTTVTPNTRTDVQGVAIADTVAKTTAVASGLSGGINQTFTGTAADYNFSVFVEANSVTNVTIGLSADNGATWRGRVEFSLTGDGTQTNRGSTNLVGTPVIEKLPLASDGTQVWRISFVATLTAATYAAFIYPDVAGGATAGSIYVGGAQVSLGATLRDYAPQGGSSAKQYVRVFDDGVEVLTTNTTITPTGITYTLASTPASASVMEVKAPFGSFQDTQRHTIPISLASGLNLQPTAISFIAP